jgi:hypothetical protein
LQSIYDLYIIGLIDRLEDFMVMTNKCYWVVGNEKFTNYIDADKRRTETGKDLFLITTKEDKVFIPYPDRS